MKKRAKNAKWAFLAVFALAVAGAQAAPPASRVCQRVEFEGEVAAGQEWKTAVGQGWVFRVLPVTNYSGWDLAVDRDPPAGYPDALLLATLPYNSINEREIGTTYRLRAQDAIGWNPRSFHFLTDPKDFSEAHWLYLDLFGRKKNSPAGREQAAMARLLQLQKGSSSGNLRILDARLVPGVADPQPFAQAWAMEFSRSQHHIEPSTASQASPLGTLLWMRFALTLWFPSSWRFPSGIKPVQAPCPD